MALVHPMMCCKSKGKFRFFFIQKWHRLQERNSKCRLGVNLLLSKLQENMIPPPSCVMVLTHKGRVAAPQNHGIAKIGKLHFTQIEEKIFSWFLGFREFGNLFRFWGKPLLRFVRRDLFSQRCGFSIHKKQKNTWNSVLYFTFMPLIKHCKSAKLPQHRNFKQSFWSRLVSGWSLVSYPTRWSLLFVFGFLWWSGRNIVQ